MGRKRALLVGINYTDDPENKLRGCWNDVERLGECLVSRYGFPKETICTLVDRPGTSPRMMPTGEVIREKLCELTTGLQWGDCIIFHFSGHGVQLPPEGEPDETGMKEAIVPVDFNMITDDDFRILVDKIPDGVAFTFIADCCHSGGLIAHSEQQVGSVHTKPTSLLSSLGPQPQEEESDEEEEPVVVSDEVMIEILASMLGSVSSQDPSVSLLEVLAMMQAANSASMDMSLLDLIAIYVASQQQNVSMSDILESMLVEEESTPEKQNAAQKAFATSTGSLQRDRQLKKDRIQHMLGSTKAHNVQRFLRSSHARRSLSTRGFGGAPYNESYGGHQHYPPQDQNRSSFSHNHSELILPHQHCLYPSPDISGSFYNDANAPWQYPPPLKYTLSDPGPYASTHSHAGAPDPSEPNPFGSHPSMQRWGSDLGSGGYGTAGHDRYSGQAMQGGLAQFQPPWAAKPAVVNGPAFGDNHDAGFRIDVHGRPELPGAWSHGRPNSCPGGGGDIYAKKRSMPLHAVTRKLSERAGRKVEAGNIRTNLYDLFGEKSSITCKAVVATILDGLTNKGGSSSARGILKRISNKSIDFLNSKLHDPKTRIDKYLRATTSASGVTPTSTLHQIPKRPDRCVLITACQSDELANEHRNVIHGAFTKVILDIIEEHKASLLDNHRLVYESRHRLAKKPYKQHPCLYSTPQQAHNVFICY
ncbi:hypothetical protein M758_4G098200 [Ceratodon purpureus]|nr:hypothetical protein M758_4G098200 [Ceratodon purpureus]